MSLKLRTYQQGGIDNVIENFNNNINSNLIVMATGTGKTLTLINLHKQFRPEQPTLFIVNRIELAYQAKESFDKETNGLSIGIEMNDHHASEDDDIVIACVQSIGRKGSYRIGKFDPDHFGMVCCDEAHYSVSDIYCRVLNYLGVGPDNYDTDKLLVGLTATPERSDNVSLSYVYDDIAINYNIRQGITDGYLTDISLLQVSTGVDLSEVDRTPTDFNTKQLDRAINIHQRNDLIVRSYKKFSSGEPCLVFANSVDHAYQLTELFNKNNITAKCIEANTPKDERKKAIKDFKGGRIKILLNYGVLTTGFNEPEISTIILARPIRFSGLVKQIVGRGIRPSEYSFINSIHTAKGRREAISVSPKPYCKVIDIHDNGVDDDIVSVPSMFGLKPSFKVDNDERKFFEEVVEPLEEIRRERKIDISEVSSEEEVELLVKKKKLNIQSLRTPQEISQHSQRDWSKVGKDKYEIVYSTDKKSILVEKNEVDKWSVTEQDSKSNNARKLNDFFDLSAAIKLADDYADKYYDTTFAEEADWKKGGVTQPQYNLLKKLYKGRIGTSYGTYSDTGVTKLYDRQLKEKIETAKHASKLINEKIK